MSKGRLHRGDAGPVWQRPGAPDLRILHNAHFGTLESDDLARLEPFLRDIDSHEATARAALTEKYHELWREAWRREGDPDHDATAFARALVFEGVSYPEPQYGSGYVALAFDDAGLFGGHALFAKLDLEGRMKDAEMFG